MELPLMIALLRILRKRGKRTNSLVIEKWIKVLMNDFPDKTELWMKLKEEALELIQD